MNKNTPTSPDKTIEVTPELTRQFASKKIEGQTIVHCKVKAPCALRVWNHTVIKADNGKNYKMVHAENVTLYPTWTHVNRYGFYSFTLFFEPLDEDVNSFSIVEEIPQPGGFLKENISRNNEGVYQIYL